MNPVTESLLVLYQRDLDKLGEELKQYPSEESMWTISGDIKNSAGNLSLHLCGNLQHFIGTVMGNSGYVRNRDAEFADKGIPRQKLLDEIAKTKKAIADTLPKIVDTQLEAQYPIDVFGKPMTTVHFLIHLGAHLGYHLGQVNYHRRLVGTL